MAKELADIGLTSDWQWNGERRSVGLSPDWRRIGVDCTGLAADWHQIDRLELVIDWHLIGTGVARIGNEFLRIGIELLRIAEYLIA